MMVCSVNAPLVYHILLCELMWLIVLSDVQSCGQSIVEVEVPVYIFSGAYCVLFIVMYMFVLRLA